MTKAPRICMVVPLLIAASMAWAQSTRKVTLTWADNSNPPGTTYSVKRATGLCTGTPTFATLATGITVKTYEDTTVTVGNYCYVVTATFSGLESPPSNTAGAPVLPKPPTLDNITVAETPIVVPAD